MNNEYIKNLLNSFIFLSLLLFLILLIVGNVSVDRLNWFVILTFFINGIVITYGLLLQSKFGYGLRDVLFLFMFIFMFLSPMVQYLSNQFPWWDDYLLNDNRLIIGNMLILIFNILFLWVYTYLPIKKYSKETINYSIKNIDRVKDVLFLLTIFFSVIIILLTGINNLFSRSTNRLEVDSSSLNLIFQYCFRSVPVVFVAINLEIRNKVGYINNKFKFIMGLLLMFLTNFPTAMPRFWSASVYLGLFIISMENFKNKQLVKLIIIFGLLVIFPTINIFRNYSFFEALTIGYKLDSPTKLLLAGDYDSYSMLIRALAYVEDNGITWGYQLLGNVLFFIPRSLWNSKPVGSGLMVAKDLGWDFKNVSMPFIGEGYLNFGILGVILFATFLGIFCYKMDSLYIVMKRKKDYIFFPEIIYPFTLGFLFFILRGDLLSSLSYYIGFSVPILLIWIIQRFRFN